MTIVNNFNFHMHANANATTTTTTLTATTGPTRINIRVPSGNAHTHTRESSVFVAGRCELFVCICIANKEWTAYATPTAARWQNKNW